MCQKTSPTVWLLQIGNAWRLLFSRKLRPELVVSCAVAFFSQINVRYLLCSVQSWTSLAECCLKSDTTVSAPAAPLCFSLLDQSVNLVGVVLTISQFLSLILTSTGDQMTHHNMTVLLIFACHACGATLLVKILSMKQTQSGRALAIQGINAILFFAPLIFKSLGRGQSSALLGAVAVSAYLGLPELVILACILV